MTSFARTRSLILDEQRPVLICGPDGSGKTSLVRHLLADVGRSTVIDPTSASYLDLPDGADTTVVTPTAFGTDEEFFVSATAAIHDALEAGTGLLVVDGFALLAAPYSNGMSAQRDFCQALSEAFTTQPGEGLTLVVVDERPPTDPAPRTVFGVRVHLGPVAAQDWVAMFGEMPLPGHAVAPAEGYLVAGAHAERFVLPGVDAAP